MEYKINLCDDQTCTQCFACEQACPKHCITHVESGSGFYIPQIDRDTCIECGACMNACHVIKTEKLRYQKPLNAYACWTKKTSDRERSSSGGAFSVLARKILQQGGVVFGATMSKDLEIKHIEIDKESDIHLLQGSKYVQSNLQNIYRLVSVHLKNNRLVLFTGTPCQISGLYVFLKRNYTNLYTCDLVCHGVPSQKAFDIYLDRMNLRTNTCSFGFRFTKGWGMQLSKTSNNSKREIIMPNQGYYLRAFNMGLMFNEPCYSCKYARPERVSDLTIADFWGIGKAKKFNHPRRKGISLMLVNNEHGLQLMNSCEDLFKEERPVEEAVKGNFNLNQSSVRPLGRDTYYEDSKNLDYMELQKKYHIAPTLKDYLRIVKQVVLSKL